MKNFLYVVAILAIMLLQACTRPSNAVEVLKKAGYTSIQLNGHGWFKCSDDDYFADEFTASGPSGHVVSGTVCAGWFKGSTIRLD